MQKKRCTKVHIDSYCSYLLKSAAVRYPSYRRSDKHPTPPRDGTSWFWELDQTSLICSGASMMVLGTLGRLDGNPCMGPRFRLEQSQLNSEQGELVDQFLRFILEWGPECRPSTDECLEHSLISNPL